MRAIVRAALPEAREELDRPGRVIGYGFGPGYSGLVCTIIPSRNGVKLGIVHEPGCPIRAGYWKVPASGIVTSLLQNPRI